jgi:hypothetical protein
VSGKHQIFSTDKGLWGGLTRTDESWRQLGLMSRQNFMRNRQAVADRIKKWQLERESLSGRAGQILGTRAALESKNRSRNWMAQEQKQVARRADQRANRESLLRRCRPEASGKNESLSGKRRSTGGGWKTQNRVGLADSGGGGPKTARANKRNSATENRTR